MSTIAAYPLQWPAGWPRARTRKAANFHRDKRDLTIADGVERVLSELGAIHVREADVIISTNVRPTLAGLPRSGERKPDDPGVAVYWQAGKHNRVLAVDRHDEVADNLAAIAKTLEAMRAIERHGGAQILERAFVGFDALPDPARRNWRDVLGCEAADDPEDDWTIEEVRERYRELASKNHPDRGGDSSRMADINRAWEQAQQELRA